MSRLIDADALIDYIESNQSGLISAREFQYDYIECINEQPTVEQNNWILCKDESPVDNEKVIGCTRDYVFYGYCDGMDWWKENIGHYDSVIKVWNRVIAWMPLPEPYRGD